MNNPAVPDDLDRWIAETLIPSWVDRAIQQDRPGYVEFLDANGRAVDRSRKTTVVTARLVYVFSHGHLLARGSGSLAAARHGMDFLLAACRRGDGAFRHAIHPDGTPIDDRADLYDLAFAIFALAWFHRATGEDAPLTIAEETMRFIETRLAHPAGGFAEDDRGALPRRQNPHMHLLEACHAMAEASGAARWLDRADGLVRLMRERLFDSETGTLGEFFAEDWRPAAGGKGRLREPGHHLEWTWLLHHHDRLTGRTVQQEVAERLYRSALAHGFGTLGEGGSAVLDEVDRDGAVVTRTCLLWPQTEAIKAFVARLEFLRDADASDRLERHLGLLFRHYVDGSSGLWVNQLDAKGRPIRAEIPVRVLYHLLLALAEAARVRSGSPAQAK